MSKIGLVFSGICLGLGITIGSSVLTNNPAVAQRKNVSAKEVKQKGNCDFIADSMTTAGTYKKTNSKEPIFEQ